MCLWEIKCRHSKCKNKGSRIYTLTNWKTFSSLGVSRSSKNIPPTPLLSPGMDKNLITFFSFFKWCKTISDLFSLCTFISDVNHIQIYQKTGGGLRWWWWGGLFTVITDNAGCLCISCGVWVTRCGGGRDGTGRVNASGLKTNHPFTHLCLSKKQWHHTTSYKQE